MEYSSLKFKVNVTKSCMAEGRQTNKEQSKHLHLHLGRQIATKQSMK